MLAPDKTVFISIPDETRPSEARKLHTGMVLSFEEGIYQAEFEEPDLLSQAWQLEEGHEILLYYHHERRFLKQPARVEGFTEGAPNPLIRFEPTGAPVNANQRSCFRVSVAFKNLTAHVGPEKRCALQDVSESGFAVISRKRHAIGHVAGVTLPYGKQVFSGGACIQSIKELRDGGWRYGFYCVDKEISAGSLPRGLRAISQDIQREHMSGSRFYR